MTDAPVEIPEESVPAVVELFGHVRLVGWVREVQQFGTSFMEVRPLLNGVVMPPVLYGGASIYSFTQIAQDRMALMTQTSAHELPLGVRSYVDPGVGQVYTLLGIPAPDDDDCEVEDEYR